MSSLIARRTLTISAASTNGVAASQTPVGASDLVLSSTVVTLPNQGQRPQIVAGATNLSNRTITIYGTDYQGRTQSISFTGPNATTYEVLLTFATITRIAISGTAAGAFSVGWAASASLAPIVLDTRYAPTDIGFSVVTVSGTPTYTARLTQADPFDGTLNPGGYTWFNHPSVVAQTGNSTGNFGKPVTMCSLYGTGEGVLDFVCIQGVAGG